MDTKHEALELAEDLETGVVPKFYRKVAAALLRRQHARIEELERTISVLLSNNESLVGERQARALLTKKD